MVDEIFKYKRVNTTKLKSYGFTEADGIYKYVTPIFDGQFNLFVAVTKDGKVDTKLIDINSQDEYVLHLVESSAGDFVGKVRAEFERVLTNIRDNCFEREIFKSAQAKEVISYIQCKYGDELEYLWEKFPTNAVWRRKDNKKWYGALIVLKKRKLGIDSDEAVDIIDLRGEPSEIKALVDNRLYFEGYHMNKNSWFTVCLDGSVPTQTVFELIDKSYLLALKK